jgi:hypothetical protein
MKKHAKMILLGKENVSGNQDPAWDLEKNAEGLWNRIDVLRLRAAIGIQMEDSVISKHGIAIGRTRLPVKKEAFADYHSI